MAKIKKSNNKTDKRIIEAIASVIKELSSTEFLVKVAHPVSIEKPIVAYNSGKIITNRIRIQENDLVKVEIDKSSISNNTINGKCRIVYRYPPGSTIDSIINQE